MRNQLLVLIGLIMLTALTLGVITLSKQGSSANTSLADDSANNSVAGNSNTVNPPTNAETETSDKLIVETTKQGSGERKVKVGDIIKVHYRGTLKNGTEFDNSYDHGQPYEFQIGMGNVIEGWDQGLIGMKVGEKRKLTIPPSLGYRGQSIGSIPANSTLYFETELVSIQGA